VCSAVLFKIASECYIKSYLSHVQHTVFCVYKVIVRKKRRGLNTADQPSKSPAIHTKGANVTVKVELSLYIP
jgi:hypothetical protein